jgi:hypothetical protein
VSLGHHISAQEMLELLRRRRGTGATEQELASWAGINKHQSVPAILSRWISEGRITCTPGSSCTVYVLEQSEWSADATVTEGPGLANWVPAGIVRSQPDRDAERDAFRRGYAAALKDMRAWLAKAGG